MPVKRKTLLPILLLVLVLVLWSPWINESYAKERSVTEFERAWLNVADGCGFACHGCGATTWKKIPFGARVTLEYACGMLPADSPEYHQQANVFVSSLGMVYGLPTP
jgi:hypothetical protein